MNIQLSSGVNGGAAAGDQLNGIEHVVATTFNDILTGDGASNTLTGLAGNDTLNGGAGNDTMDGGTGADLLRGGADADTFEFNTGDGPDTIIDFEVGTDTIDLSATGLSFGDLTITDIGVNATIAYGTDMITVFNTTAAQPDQNQFDFGP